MEEFEGYLPSYKLIIPDYTDNQQSMILTTPVSLMADQEPKVYDGVLLENTKVIFDNYTESMTPTRMVKTSVVSLQGDFVPDVYNGIDKLAGTVISGLYNNSVFSGVITNNAEKEIQYIYRTVGSPRRYPLESSWQKSKEAEPIIIDEVDGDVDE